MNVFGISDLHLSFAKPKPMDVFGGNWQNHADRIKCAWESSVTESDVVLMPGDTSWAMRLEQAMPDLEFIDRLPGTKVITRGNHDYWWDSINKLRAAGLRTIHFVQGDVVRLGDMAVSGTRLWSYPFIRWQDSIQGAPPDEEDSVLPGQPPVNHEKIRNRETQRLNRCLDAIRRFDDCTKIILTHFPPIGSDLQPNTFTEILSDFDIDLCLFGHLHSIHADKVVDMSMDDVRYVLASCDALEFKPKLLCSI